MILRIQGPNLVKRWNTNFDFIWDKRSRVVGGPGGFHPEPPDCEDDEEDATPARRVTSTDLLVLGYASGRATKNGMAERVVLHVGTMKSGTTFLQNVVSNNRDVLREQGVSFVGRKWREQIKAAQDAIEHGGEKQKPIDPDGPWAKRRAARCRSGPAPSLFSVEFFGARKSAKIEQIVASFGDTPLTIVLTVRDLARSIPSMWQESVQNGGRATWEDYLRAVREERRDDPVGQSFWRQQGVAGMARRWAGPWSAGRTSSW